MTRALAILAALAVYVGCAWVAFGDIGAVTPCPAPSSGVAYPVDGNGVPTGDLAVPFHLAPLGVPMPLFWGGAALAQAPGDPSTYGTGSACPSVVVHFYEDAYGRCWAKETATSCGGAQVERWCRVVSP